MAVRSFAEGTKHIYKNGTMAVELHCFVSFSYIQKDSHVACVEVVYNTSPGPTTRAVCGGLLLEGLRL
jgi:hypothetical protein